MNDSILDGNFSNCEKFMKKKTIIDDAIIFFSYNNALFAHH